MEKTISQEDRIKRAEEIYYRRNNINSGRTATVNLTPKKEYKLLKKLSIQVLICVGIYFLIYWLQANTDNFFTDSVGYIKSTLEYDEDFMGWLNNAKNYIAEWIAKEEQKNDEETLISQEETLAATEESNNNNAQIKDETNGETEEQLKDVQDTSNISQMEQDAEYIKANFSLVKPITGTITSRFGLRNPTTATVPKYHTGIDIAVNEGTVFVSAMDGIVEQVSSQGDYRKSCKNYKWRCNNTLCTL